MSIDKQQLLLIKDPLKGTSYLVKITHNKYNPNEVGTTRTVKLLYSRASFVTFICEKTKQHYYLHGTKNRTRTCKILETIKEQRTLTLPTDSNVRKDIPVLSGCVKYFPAALAGVAQISKLGNDKHNPGEPLHHARGKSMDHGDCIIRHLMDAEDLLAAAARGNTTVTPEAVLAEVNQLAWRVLAYAQDVHEQYGAPLAPGAKK